MKFSSKLFSRVLITIEVLYILIFPVLFLNVFIANALLFKTGYFTLFLALFALRIIALIHLLLIVLKHFYLNVIKAGGEAQKANRRLLTVTLIFVLLSGEIIFSFIPQSQGNTQNGLAQYIWYVYNNGVPNEMGYRDEKIEGREVGDKKKIIFLGDSFTYGTGIENRTDRYSDIVAKDLEKDFVCYNLGRGGSDTKDEFIRLKQYPVKPDILVFQYYFNDIEPVATEFGYFEKSGKNALLFHVLSIPVKCSFFLNFIAANSLSIIPLFPEGVYRTEVGKAFNDDRCLKEHIKDLENIIHYCKENSIKLYVLLLPDLTDIAFSEQICFSKIKPLLDLNKVDYTSLQNELKIYPPEKLIVGKLDNHANEFSQTIIAEKLLEEIKEFK